MTGSSSKATHRYSIEPRVRKYVKGYGFCHLREICLINMENNYWILLLKQLDD